MHKLPLSSQKEILWKGKIAYRSFSLDWCLLEPPPPLYQMVARLDWHLWGSAAGHCWSTCSSWAQVRCKGLVWWRTKGRKRRYCPSFKPTLPKSLENMCPSSQMSCISQVNSFVNIFWFLTAKRTKCCILVRFAVCDHCILIEDNIKQSAKNPHQLKVWQEAKKIHREYVRNSECGDCKLVCAAC